MDQPVPDSAGTERGEGAATVIACDLLLESLKRLADGGDVEAACRLAGRACVRLRHDYPAQARRFDVLLHRMTPKLGWAAPPQSLSPGGRAGLTSGGAGALV